MVSLKTTKDTDTATASGKMDMFITENSRIAKKTDTDSINGLKGTSMTDNGKTTREQELESTNMLIQAELKKATTKMTSS